MGEPALDGIIVTNSVPPSRLAPCDVGKVTILDASASVASAIAACREES